jgi:hypothetical protein
MSKLQEEAWLAAKNKGGKQVCRGKQGRAFPGDER